MEQATLASSVDQEASTLPSLSESCGLSPALGAAHSGSPNLPQDSSNSGASVRNDFTMEKASEEPLVRSSSISDDYLQFLGQPHHMEKRFPVDRRKLEKLIKEGGRDHETAGDFFKRVQESTDTLVLWPSRLKIGAKSKKDPQVKVVGTPSNIQRARELILEDLDAKSTRVTLKIDVAFSEHSHVIGKEGVNIKKVHNDTSCHIHFPDSNRFPNAVERSNQVSVTGQAANVEMARKRIRDLLPAVVTFALPFSGMMDPNSPDNHIQHIMLQYNVVVHLKPQSRHGTLLLVVRGTIKYIDGLKLAVSALVEYFTGDIHLVPVVTMNLDIATQHHRTLIGSGGGNIRKIMTETSATIQFPDPQSRYQANQVVVTGTVDSVFKAREQLLGCLPAVLMFDVHESDDNILSSCKLGELSQKLDLFISVKPKKGQLQSIIIKSIEQNIQCMYRARTSLLELSYQPISSSPSSSSFSPSPTPVALTMEPTKPFSPIAEEPPEVVVPKNFERRVSFKTAEKEPKDDEEAIKNSHLERRVSFKTEEKEPRKVVEALKEEEEEEEIEASNGDKSMDGRVTPPPSDMRLLSSSSGSGQRSSATPPVRLTTRHFLDYDRKKEQAHLAMKSKVEPNKTRYPTTTYAGDYFSASMPEAPPAKTPPSPSSTPQGLSSINRTSYQALMNQASQERAQNLQSEQDMYRGVDDLCTLLKVLNLEHYESCFQQEEVDLDTFLTMTEGDMKEVGVTTLGARRKLQIAISEMKKLQGKAPLPLPVPSPRSSGLQGRSLFQSGAGSRSMTMGLSPHRGADPGGMNRSASLTRVVDMNRRGSDTGQGGMNRSASLTRGSDAGHGGMNRSASLTREPKLNWMSNSGRF